MAGEVRIQTVVQLIKFGAYRKFSVPKPPLLLAAIRYTTFDHFRQSSRSFKSLSIFALCFFGIWFLRIELSDPDNSILNAFQLIKSLLIISSLLKEFQFFRKLWNALQSSWKQRHILLAHSNQVLLLLNTVLVLICDFSFY